LLPICYQIFEGVPDKGVEKYFARMGLWMVFDCEELVGEVSGNNEDCLTAFIDSIKIFLPIWYLHLIENTP
jgi:hypothetical protein